MELPVLTCRKFLELLQEFYDDRPDPPPIDAAFVEPADIPQPQRELLVHDHDMTSTLGRHHGEPITLQVLERKRDRDWYSRHIVLSTAHSKRPAEYGAIRICLPLLDEPTREEVLQGNSPMGGILNSQGVFYRSCPGAFFKIFSNDIINASLQLESSQWLFGRCNCLSDRHGRTMAEVIEILPSEDTGTGDGSARKNWTSQ